MDDFRTTIQRMASEEYDCFKEAIISGKFTDNDASENSKKITDYVIKLMLSCEDNKLCNDSIASIFCSAFIQGAVTAIKLMKHDMQ